VVDKRRKRRLKGEKPPATYAVYNAGLRIFSTEGKIFTLVREIVAVEKYVWFGNA